MSLLQNEISRHEAQRESLAQELVNVTAQLEDVNTKLTDKQSVEEKFADMERQYNALLQVDYFCSC